MKILTKYLDDCLQNARYFNKPSLTETFFMQAFGAVNLFVLQKFNSDIEGSLLLADKAIKMWDEVYRPQFDELGLWS